MDRRITALILILIVGLSGCSNGAGNETMSWPLPDDKALDREVVALESGMSLESVEARLGEPESDRSSAEEPAIQTLFYGRWQLMFKDGRLDRRIKYVFERPFPDPSVVDQEEKAFDRKVSHLNQGASMATVKVKLGPPDTYEIVESAPRKEEVLSYELWELTFVDGSLIRKHKR